MMLKFSQNYNLLRVSHSDTAPLILTQILEQTFVCLKAVTHSSILGYFTVMCEATGPSPQVSVSEDER